MIAVIMLFSAGLPLKWLGIAAGVGIASVPILWNYVLKDYQKTRILVLFDPSIDVEQSRQATYGKIAIGSGQFTGQGWTNGTMTQMQYVPENQTDYIFSVAGEELGFLGCLLIIILLMALIIGIIGGVSESRFVKAFINGAADMMSVVLIIALARSITVLMASTGLDMWILNNAAAALEGMSAIIFAPLSFLLYVVLSFLIPSSSGMATVSIPIMGGLAHQLNFSVETMVMIYSAGNGLVNLFTPTSGAIMGGLALAKIEYSTWLKFGAKLFVILGVVCMIILTAAMLILPGAA